MSAVERNSGCLCMENDAVVNGIGIGAIAMIPVWQGAAFYPSQNADVSM